MSIHRGLGKEDVVHIYKGILHKNKWNNITCSNMGRPRDYHTKWSKSEKDKYHMISLIGRISKNDTNELTSKTETDTYLEN